MTAAYTQAIKIAADSVDKLRKQDVYRVLEWNPEILGLADWIKSQRPDLSDEVDAVCSELTTI